MDEPTAFGEWVRRVVGRQAPIGAQPTRELIVALLDTLLRDVAPLALEAAGLGRVASRFRFAEAPGSPEGLRAAQGLAGEGRTALAELGRPYHFLSSLSMACAELDAAWAAPDPAERLGPLFASSACLELAVSRAVHAGAAADEVRELLVRTLERFLPLA